MDWTEDKGGAKRWHLDADPAYVVEMWGLGSYSVYVNGKKFGIGQGWGSKDDAMAVAEQRYDSPEGRIERAQRFIAEWGSFPGDHHRTAVIRNISSILAGRPVDMTDMP
jgi:hypothetical protein